jgi:hypothetical protein
LDNGAPNFGDPMTNEEARRLLARELEVFRRESYADLVRRIDADPVVYERDGSGSTRYQLEIQVLWDGPRGGDVRVMGSVDDGGLWAFVPLTRSFIKTADESVIGE